MNVFELRERLIDDYSSYIRSFIRIRDERIDRLVSSYLDQGLLWPDPLIQLNPSFQYAGSIDDLVAEGLLHAECSRVFRVGKENGDGRPLRLYQHQADAIRRARAGRNYVLTTGTGSGKSLAYLIPIVDHVLRNGTGRGIQAIVVYPMNALANSQFGELGKFLKLGYPDGKGPATFARYTGQEGDEERNAIVAQPPDILLTNYVMLELILTRVYEKQLVKAAQGLRFLVLDELHTYRGRQGADVALLVRRAREFFGATRLQVVGTSATLAGPGTYDQQQGEVAAVATVLFGAEVAPSDVVGETLQRATPEEAIEDPAYLTSLRRRVEDDGAKSPLTYQALTADPLSSWIEGTFGIYRDNASGRLRRRRPRTITGQNSAAGELSRVTGVDEAKAKAVIQEALLAGYQCERNPETGFPAFAFRLHQFISRGDTVYASLETENDRHLTFNRQQFVPGDRRKILLPMVFCRECGQEYYCVRRLEDSDSGAVTYVPRELSDRSGGDGSKPGFLHFSAERPWPSGTEEELTKLPEDWIEDTNQGPRVKAARKKNLPRPVTVSSDGTEIADGISCHFVESPFRFCLHCRVSYDFRTTSDFGKLTSLGTEGRSTATTILSLATIRHLRKEGSLAPRAQKLLSFTDNRQDASLQAGHFNDFVEIGLLRSALLKACCVAKPGGLTHEVFTQRVFDALGLPFASYSKDPDLKFQARLQTERAFRDVIGYRLYHDLRRGWRVTSPNLEQCGLLEINYLSLEDLSNDTASWQNLHPALAGAAPVSRCRIAKTLLDFMRRELAVQVDYLDATKQETIQQQSSQRLIAPWALDENEILEHAATLYPRSVRQGDSGGDVFVTARSGFGLYLRRTGTFPDYHDRISTAEATEIIRQLLGTLRLAGLVEVVDEPQTADDVPGYRLPASAILWREGDGAKPFRDPIRVPGESEAEGRTNPFFVDFYRSMAFELAGFEAREHTAQVPYEDRLIREDRFRKGELPILYCSPTMELGVDIAELNVVNMRNIPPTPANYAQRSGRAGRSGQPALVFSYCTTGSPHDQYFFKRSGRMVSGEVTPPRLELANEDLVRAHLHAIWLAEAGLSLGTSLRDLLDVAGNDPTLATRDTVLDTIRRSQPRLAAQVRAQRILATFADDLKDADWFTPQWTEEVFKQIELNFEAACERWRNLCKAALAQQKTQNAIIMDMARSPEERRQAERLRREAESQYKLLTETQNVLQSDFYSYRYFASEGFLPGYNFPRLPLSAYIPGRRTQQRDEFLSRPRFLAITEFGPRAVIYHEGSRYLINKAILPLGQDGPVFGQLKRCTACGYLHPVDNPPGPDLCENCGAGLDFVLNPMLRLQNVSTRRKDKINSDEEERLRLGYETQSGYRYAVYRGVKSHQTALIRSGSNAIGQLNYGHAATLWRINLGWTRRAIRDQYGFVLDIERGYWQRNDLMPEDDDVDQLTHRLERVIPYVEDRRNSLVFEPKTAQSVEVITSLAYALKNAIQVIYQLEDDELACELLPNGNQPRYILLYEAAEGGAGVLRRLLKDPQAFPNVAREALRICHFNPGTGEDEGHAPGATETCEAACYDCLLSYSNQLVHRLLDRKAIRDVLLDFERSAVSIAPAATPRSEHLAQLTRLCGSKLEECWLKFLEDNDHHLPTSAQVFIDSCKTRPDFFYEDHNTAIYIDGPPHQYPDRKQRDQAQTEAMEDRGYTVIRFGAEDDWAAIVKKYPSVFGGGK
ncbi:MAG: DEAD/DEAH box helicase [Bryobacterales bacterium]|nr:DEAD/DEAH box helicase [Bryobacterales bacterium]